jgi:hypothetical protein
MRAENNYCNGVAGDIEIEPAELYLIPNFEGSLQAGEVISLLLKLEGQRIRCFFNASP